MTMIIMMTIHSKGIYTSLFALLLGIINILLACNNWGEYKSLPKGSLDKSAIHNTLIGGIIMFLAGTVSLIALLCNTD